MNAINSVSAQTGVTATASTTVQGAAGVGGGTFSAGDIYINGIDLGEVTFSANDSTGTLAAAINRITDQTGVTASIVDGGKLKLTSEDGWDIHISTASDGTGDPTAAQLTALGMTNTSVNGAAAAAFERENAGVITLESDNAITLGGNNETYAGFTDNQTINVANSISTADVTTYDAAQLTIRKADHALAQLDRTRSDIGSVQNQLESTIRNISVTQVNVTAAESQIRDVDFAEESSRFAKYNILAQSGSYALSQANAVQQNVLRLLQ
jgi:flagellin